TILMTAHDRIEIAANHASSPLLGAFLRKPIDVTTILTVVEQLLHRLCDRVGVARYSTQPEAAPADVPPRPAPQEPAPIAAPIVESIPSPAAPVKTGSYWSVVLPLLLAGFAAGWFGRVALLPGP